MDQRFEVQGHIYATALVKGVFVGPREKINPREVAQATGHDDVSPPMPDEVRAWLACGSPQPELWRLRDVTASVIHHRSLT